MNTAKPTDTTKKMGLGMRLCQYVVSGVVLGIVCGGICLLFCFATSVCDAIGQGFRNLIFVLPAAGLLVVYLYDKKFKGLNLDTNSIYRYLHDGEPISKWQAPLIFLSTCLAYLFSGSVGRAGSAMQIGSCVAYLTGNKLEEAGSKIRIFLDLRPDMLMACGMAAAFTSIFKSPVAGAVFGVEMLVLSRKKLDLIIPAGITSFVTYIMGNITAINYTDIHTLFGVEDPTNYDPVTIEFNTLWKVIVIVLCTVILARAFCVLRRLTSRWFNRYLPNPFVRVLVGTGLVIAITLLIGHRECNGLGFETAGIAIIYGHTKPLDFLFKLVLTLLTLGCGIRGGEISPNIFIGATFGCAAAPYLHMNPCLAASVGMIGTLSSVTNSTIAIFIMGLELISFTPVAAFYLAVTCLITHMVSGSMCLYSGQETTSIPFKLKY